MNPYAKLCMIVVATVLILNSNAQSYPQVKVNLRNGVVIKGKAGFINSESVSLTQAGQRMTYPLSDVMIIQAKQGKSNKWAVGCGTGCLAFYLVGGVFVTDEQLAEGGYARKDLYVEASYMTILSAVAGYLIGYLLDNYDTVYSGPSSFLQNKIDLNLSRNALASYNLTLSCNLNLSGR